MTIKHINLSLINALFINLNHRDYDIFHENMWRLFILYELMTEFPTINIINEDGLFWNTSISSLKISNTIRYVDDIISLSSWLDDLSNEYHLKYIWLIEYCDVNKIQLNTLTLGDIVQLKEPMRCISSTLGKPTDDECIHLRGITGL